MIPMLTALALRASTPYPSDAPLRTSAFLSPPIGARFPAATQSAPRPGSCIPAVLLGGFVGYLVGGTLGAGVSVDSDHEGINKPLFVSVLVLGIIAGGVIGYGTCRS